MPDDPYIILGLARGCTQEELKQAYRKLAKRYHPDINRSTAASEMMRRVNSAYSILSDPEKRSLYDHISPVEPSVSHPSSDDTDRYQYEESPPAGGFKYEHYTWEPPRREYPNINYSGGYGTSNRLKAYIGIIAVVLLSLSYLFILPLVYGSGSTSPIITYSPTIPVATPAAISPTALAQQIPVATAYIPTTLPKPTPTVTPAPAPTTTAVPSSGYKAPLLTASMLEPGIVKGKVIKPGEGTWPGNLYVAICDANNTTIQYYRTVTGPAGYYQFSSVNSTAGPGGVTAERYVLYARDNTTNTEAYSQPFGVGPYAIVNEDLSLS